LILGSSSEDIKGLHPISSRHFVPELSILQNHLGMPDDNDSTHSKRFSQPTDFEFVSIDEVGRGCVAGPVVVAACRWRVRADKILSSEQVSDDIFFENFIKDSKKLSAKQRNVAAATLSNWAPFSVPKAARQRLPNLSQPLISRCYRTVPELARAAIWIKKISVTLDSVALGTASIAEIERKNIWGATQIAMGRALCSIHGAEDSGTIPNAILFDGKQIARVPSHWKQVPFVTVISGDSQLRSIGAASILAKVYRDNQISELDRIFPDYGFAQHKGYGTKNHFAAIAQHGLTKHHRPSFLRNMQHSEPG
jgi:ribonuclease HII